MPGSPLSIELLASRNRQATPGGFFMARSMMAVSPLEIFVHLVRAALLSWLAAALLFLSGTKGAGFFVLALLAAGFGLCALAFWRALFNKHPAGNVTDAP